MGKGAIAIPLMDSQDQVPPNATKQLCWMANVASTQGSPSCSTPHYLLPSPTIMKHQSQRQPTTMKACYLRLLHVGKQNVRWGFEYKNEISCIQPSLRQMLSAKILLLAFDMFVIPSFHFVIALVYIQLFISYIGFIVVVQWRNITTSNGVKSLYQK